MRRRAGQRAWRDSTAKGARVHAQHHETGYHGEPDGPNAWIGQAKLTVKMAE